MPTIRVDDEVYRALQGRAQPFVDTPNDVLRRLLELDAAPKSRKAGGTRRGRVGRTPDVAFRLPILRTLDRMGGRGRSDEVLAGVLELMRSELRPVDFEAMASGQIRWMSAAAFERLHMARLTPPLVAPDSPRGTWEITEAGRTYLRSRANSE